MPSSHPTNIEESFLNFVKRDKIPVTLFLINGVKLQGIISCFDTTCLILHRDSYAQLIYKHAISTLVPSQPVEVVERTPPPSSHL